MTSHHVKSSCITLGHIPAGHSYEKMKVSPFSMPSLQSAAFPSIALNSNSQSSMTYFFISNAPFCNQQLQED